MNEARLVLCVTDAQVPRVHSLGIPRARDDVDVAGNEEHIDEEPSRDLEAWLLLRQRRRCLSRRNTEESHWHPVDLARLPWRVHRPRQSASA